MNRDPRDYKARTIPKYEKKQEKYEKYGVGRRVLINIGDSIVYIINRLDITSNILPDFNSIKE